MRTCQILLWGGFLTIFLACGSKQKNDSSKLSKQSFQYGGVTKASSFSVFDSLTKYSNADSLVIHFNASFEYLDDDSNKKIDTSEAFFYEGKLNKAKFGMYAYNGWLFFYQYRQNKWIRNDSIEIGNPIPADIKFTDINGDGTKDIMIETRMSFDKANHDMDDVFFLYKSDSKIFSYNSNYHLENMEYDTVNQFVRCSIGGNNSKSHCIQKWAYLIKGDNLICNDSEVCYCDDAEAATIEYATYRDNQRVLLKQIKGNPDSLWNIFSTSLWNSTNKWKMPMGI